MNWMKLIVKVPKTHNQSFRITPLESGGQNIIWDYPPKDWMGQQNPQEFETYVNRMIELGVKSTVHIGALNGGNEWYITRRYRELGLTCSFLSVDFQVNARAIQTYEILRNEFGVHVDFRLSNTKDLRTKDLGGPFDACFIDACHDYDYVKNDFELVEPIVTKMIGFHDINNIYVEGEDVRPEGSRVFWSEIKQKYRHEEITFQQDGFYGIGIIYKDRQIGLL